MVSESRQTNLYRIVERLKSSLTLNPGKTTSPNPKESTLPKAAVAIVLHPDRQNNDLQLLLIKRKTREGDPWSGQMALPGGRYSETDGNLLTTAIREVMEETGLDLREFSILGALDDVIPGNFSICVTPYVALSREDVSVRIEPNEVESFVWIPLSFFMDKRNLQPYNVARFGQSLEFPSYKFIGNLAIWGMTLRIIEDLLSKL